MTDQVTKTWFLGHGDWPGGVDGFENYILCTEFYHCTPSQLDDEDVFVLAEHMAYRTGINKAKK